MLGQKKHESRPRSAWSHDSIALSLAFSLYIYIYMYIYIYIYSADPIDHPNCVYPNHSTQTVSPCQQQTHVIRRLYIHSNCFPFPNPNAFGYCCSGHPPPHPPPAVMSHGFYASTSPPLGGELPSLHIFLLPPFWVCRSRGFPGPRKFRMILLG